MKLFNRIKEEAKQQTTFEDQFSFINEALELGLAKMDNPSACSGTFVWKDGSKIEFPER